MEVGIPTSMPLFALVIYENYCYYCVTGANAELTSIFIIVPCALVLITRMVVPLFGTITPAAAVSANQ